MSELFSVQLPPATPTLSAVSIPLGRIRRETPGCEAFLHFDNAGASPMAQPAFDRFRTHLEQERLMGGYAAHRIAAAELDAFNVSVAKLINAKPSEIAFAENATRAWDMAFYGIDFEPGDRILCCRSEYSSNYLAFLQVAQSKGVEVDIVPDGADGTVDIASLKNRLDGRVRLVNLCHAPTNNGLVNDAAAVGSVMRDHPGLFFLDACQSIGQCAIDVEAIGCDVLSATGRKFLRGPRGTGFLYVASHILEQITPPFADLRSASSVDGHRLQWAAGSKRFESWECPAAAKLGLKAAIDYALEIGLAPIEERVAALGNQLRTGLARIRGVEVLDRGTCRSAITTFAAAGAEPLALRDWLREKNCSATVIDPKDAPVDVGTPQESMLRLSPHYFNTEVEVDRLCSLIESYLAGRV